MNQVLRSFLAFIIAPLIPAAWFIYILGFGKAVPVLLVCYAITCCVALPLYLVMLKKHWVRWWHFCLLAIVPALSLDIGLYTMAFFSESRHNVIVGDTYLVKEGALTMAGYISAASRMAKYSLLGVTAGLCFWAIAHSGARSNKRSQRSAQSAPAAG